MRGSVHKEQKDEHAVAEVSLSTAWWRMSRVLKCVTVGDEAIMKDAQLYPLEVFLPPQYGRTEEGKVFKQLLH